MLGEYFMDQYIKPAAAEFLGSFLIVFTGSGAIMVDVITGGALGQVGVSVVFGLAVAVMILLFGPVSGGHFNPAISLVMLAVRGLHTKRLLIYVSAQLAGGLLGAVALMQMLGNIADLGTPVPNLEIATVADISSTVLIVALEFIFAAMFLAVVLAVSKRTRLEGTIAAFSVGSAVALVTFVGGPITGAALNPARYFGPAVVSGALDYIVIYLSAILVGAFTGALIFRLVIDPTD